MTDFNNMNKTELRAYLIQHPEDKSAFQAFVDRYTSEADPAAYSPAQSLEEIGEVDNLIQQRLTKSQTS